MNLQELESWIGKARAHFYKPTQIAEILYRDRVIGDIELHDLESYRNISKKWRDDISIWLVGRKCASSQKYQDDLFRAVTPQALVELSQINRKSNGSVENLIYKMFAQKHGGLSSALDYIDPVNFKDFTVLEFLSKLDKIPGLKRSIGKVYECLVYTLFQTLVESFNIKVSLEIDTKKLYLVEEFSRFASRILSIDHNQSLYTQKASFHRVGVTNAADRGLDIWGNFGTIVQIKHLTLNEDVAHDIVGSISGDRIVIVCKSAEERVIKSLLGQLGWKSRIQAIVTLDDLIEWYEKVLRGKYSPELGENLLNRLVHQLELEFPNNKDDRLKQFMLKRRYTI